MHQTAAVQCARGLELLGRMRSVRGRTASLCAPLSVEDHALQSMADASPAKWHLAHTTWFFETFVLEPLGEAPHDPRFRVLFNSYYDGAGPRAERARRGLVSRPALAEVMAYRRAVDDQMSRALEAGTFEAAALDVVELGLHHEQQHQELILTDVKHALGTQPYRAAYRADLPRERGGEVSELRYLEFGGGVLTIGAGPTGFAYDNERPRHRVYLEAFQLATRPIANAEVLAFIEAGGYRDPRLWLSDGFALARAESWECPLYWERRDDRFLTYDLSGTRVVEPAETACHLSFYEADAIARWLGARLPTESEWEAASAAAPIAAGHWADDDRLAPKVATGPGLAQMFGDVWEWTASAYGGYPGFTPLGGTLGEYNGKFMSGQMVLRGGSCFSPREHVRGSYRNFFPPGARWQMSGARLARNR
jgi:ergothioneine biosynthesis protein EgtB